MKEKLHVTFVRGPIVFAKGAFNNEATPAIGFAYLAGYVMKHGYEVEIVDAIGEALNRIHPLAKYPGFMGQGLTVDEILGRIPAHTDVIGFSGMFSGEWPVNRDLIDAVRERFPNALLVAGGEHVTALPEYSLRDCPALDLVVKGEGEHTFYELLEAYGETRDYSTIAGISFIDENGEYRDNGRLPRVRDVDSIPWPYWPEGYLETFWAAGKSHGVLTERDMPMLASRGCPYRCTFCSSPQMWTTRYVLRDPDDVLDEIEHYIRRYDITSIQFYDLTAITKKRWILEFGEKMLARGIKVFWSLPAGTRSEVLDQETLSIIKKTGCHYLVYAPESGSRRSLEVIRKQITLERITESMRCAKRIGLVLRANLIIGFPHETRRDVYQTILFGLKLSWLGVDEVPLFIFCGYPGTEIFEQLHKDGVIELNDNYFLSMASLNSEFSSLDHKTFNPNLSPVELAFYRTSFMMLNYVVGYIRYPRRMVRTFKNLVTGSTTATVFEHRIRDALKRSRSGQATST